MEHEAELEALREQEQRENGAKPNGQSVQAKDQLASCTSAMIVPISSAHRAYLTSRSFL